MSKEKAEIQQVTDKGLRIIAHRPQTCSKCSLRQGCGQYLLRRSNRLVMDMVLEKLPGERMGSCHKYSPGDEIELQLDEGRLTRLVFWFYGLPLACMILAVALGAVLGFPEISNMLLAVSGLVLGISTARHYLGQEAHAGYFLPGISASAHGQNAARDTSCIKEHK